MAYTTEHITQMLKRAREARSLSQRALSIQAGVPQGHISKIESGHVDLRLSSLSELAHVLGLEVMLVPRRCTPAVQAIVQGAKSGTDWETYPVPRELDELQDSVAYLLRTDPTRPELAALQRHAREIAKFAIHEPHLKTLRDISSRVGSLVGLDIVSNLAALQGALERIRSLRNVLAQEAAKGRETVTVWPAYRLDENDDG